MNSAIARLRVLCSTDDQLRRPYHPDRGQSGYSPRPQRASADLIYLDPPFNSNRNYAAPVGSAAAGAAFKDTWTLSDLDMAWMGLIADEQPAMYQVLQAAGLTHGKGMQSYLCMMAVRLLEMRRVLKDTGSIYLHCDPTASHYLKMLMDSIYGQSNFHNEIAWKRTSGRSGAHGFGRVHDTILFYRKSETFTWNPQWLPLSEEHVTRAYRNEDERGRWQSDQLTASGLRAGESGEPWRGVDPSNVGRHWATPTQGAMHDYIIEQELIPGWPKEFPGVQARLDALDGAGLVHWPNDGNGMPRLKRYLAAAKGTAVEDIIADIAPVGAQARERIGYPTQKPLALLERIIKASSNEGDVVLDPFCGCATACVAAENLGRRWIGIDISPKAVELVNMRLQQSMGDLFHNRLAPPVPTSPSAPTSTRRCRIARTSTFCSVSRRAGATVAAASFRFVISPSTTLLLNGVAEPITSKTSSCCAATATA